jgi:hypothetical protein
MQLNRTHFMDRSARSGEAWRPIHLTFDGACTGDGSEALRAQRCGTS